MTLGDVVAARLRDSIIVGELRPGQHLREEEISAMLQVSRGPVRDAFLVLQREGLVQVMRHRGARVVDLSATDLGEVYSLRAAIEDLAVRLAIRRRTDADIAAMQASLGDMRSGLRRRINEQDAARLDVEFHDTIFAAAHHERLYESWSAIRMQVFLLLLRRNIANADWKVATVGGHAQILELIQASDEEGAAKAVRFHVSTGYERIVAGQLERVQDAADQPLEDDVRSIADSFLLR
ncbi:GntR family transcriptional regulator [Nakamurella flavida]|uniref:GntR family transcriptional regulator n=1 Tax=Nakamurella flavida TaxID=363630 RepID=A0A939C4A1_9ACTN|nr:GntR family transcriptional regulator [Nakamurella flavida]MBM9477886.1 GntR family transcriptional regulator [Nakamurella flavida]MDP9778400.1 DNA-binding GntR family transcriptional regulator [Nakamurella flavida]